MNIQKLKPFLALTAGVVLQVCLGGIYAWSIFVPPLKESFGFSSADTQLVFGLSLMSHTTSMIFVGKIIDLVGYRKLIYFSSLFTASGYLISGYFGSTVSALLLGIGILNGIGIACGYLCAIQNGVNWFPKQKGLVTGIAVAGYGGGAILLSFLAEFLLAKGWQVLEIFKVVGFTYGFLIFLTSLFFFEPERKKEPVKEKDSIFNSLLKQFKEIDLPVKDFRLWALVSGIMLGSYPAVALIGSIKPIALYYDHPLAIASLAVTFIAIGNASGRIVWGSLQDKLGSQKTTIFSLLSISLSIIFLYLGYLNPFVFLFACFWIGFSFGACLSIYAAQTADFFGAEKLSNIYPFVLWFYGISALIGPWVTGFGLDQTNSYNPGFIVALFVSLLGLILYYLLIQKSKSLQN